MAATNGQFWTQVFLKADGSPYTGIQCDHWVAGGTTTNLDVYQDANLAAPHNNPVIGDNSGRVSFYGNGTYRLRIRTSTADGNLTLYDWDNVEILHHTATMRAEDRSLSLPAASAASRGRLVGLIDGGGDITGLWMQRTAAAWMQLLTLPTLSQMIAFNKGSDIASTTSVTIPTDGNFFDITGTNNIESFSSISGYPVIYTRFTGIGLTLVHNGVTLNLRTGGNRVTLQNEIICWLQVANGQWSELWSTKDWMPAGGGTGLSTLTPGALYAGNGLLPMQSSGTGEIYQAAVSGATGAPIWSYGMAYHGPGSIGSGSTRTHEGIVNINTNQNLSGIHFYTDFTLASGVTLTVPAGGRRIVIIASRTITINGTILATGAGAAATGHGTDQPAGNGGNGNTGNPGSGGGDVLLHGIAINSGTTQITGGAIPYLLSPDQVYGGAGGGNGGAGSGGGGNPQGGRGGGTVVLLAPSITFGVNAAINTSGVNGTAAAPSTGSGGGGGGGAGNIYVYARVLIDNGVSFAQAAGAGGAGNGIGTSGAAGAAGVRQIILYG